MKAKDILKKYYGLIDSDKEVLDVEFERVIDNSKEVVAGDIFVAHMGDQESGLNYIEEAFNNGAVLAIIPKGEKIDKYPFVEVEDTREFISFINLYIYRDQIPKNIITVTGTNGKTSVSSFVSQLLKLLGKENILIGSLGVFFEDRKIADSITTPPNIDLVKYFYIAKQRNIEFVVMESSSHGTHQKRNAFLPFIAKGFTNLTPEHLDYHKTIENYYNAKEALFTENIQGNAVVNVDDIYGKRLYETIKNKYPSIIDYGREARVIKLLDISYTRVSQKVKVLYNNNTYEFSVNVLGEFQIYNILCAMGLLMSSGFDFDDILAQISNIKEVDGRLNFIKNDVGLQIFVDYAHTPNALEEVLKTLKKYNPEKLKLVFGCGGDRDSLKRPIMGKIASHLADVIYVTDDNPRFEDPNKIRQEIIEGIKKENPNKEYYNIGDRKEAIKKAVENVKPNEILLVAGKGYEQTQKIKGINIHFSDFEEIYKLLKGKK